VLEELIAIVRAELLALADAGVTYVQLDEPGLPAAPYGLSMTDAAAAINRAFDGIEARSAVHVCFGNNAGRPMADRRLDRLLPAIETLVCDQLVLEFANREMAEIELLAGLAERFEIAAGVVDVKNWHVESAEDVARRLELCLAHMPAGRLTVTADCGFSALSRQVAREKMQAMVAGARLVRGRLQGHPQGHLER
jgi:5-methyltetrahydropteroyltriglutamate--homocysteine methyltransferase